MQPAYIRFDDRNMEEPMHVPDPKSYLGVWNITESLYRTSLIWAKYAFFALLIVTSIIDLITEHPVASVLNALAYIVVALTFVLRGERMLFFGIIALFFGGVFVKTYFF